jgi:hypothetical protein
VCQHWLAQNFFWVESSIILGFGHPQMFTRKAELAVPVLLGAKYNTED